LLLCSVALATNYSALEKALNGAPGVAEKQKVLDDFLGKNPDLSSTDSDLESRITDYLSEDKPDKKQTDALERSISSRARLEGTEATPSPDVIANVKSIKGSVIYKSDKGPESQSNWVSKALEHLKDLFRLPTPSRASTGMPALGGLGLIGKVFIAIVVIALIGLVVWLLTQFRYHRNLDRKASALLEEDEPERTADEWLELADGLTSQGRYREAVRCLYLACLLRFDEAGISRFERSQTNWEHLARFRASPKRPLAIEFSQETRAFDTVWYGGQVRGIEDVEQFRSWYSDVMLALKGAKAA
jgi:hypothetical protein